MKRIIYILITLLYIGVIIGCEKNDDNNEQITISGQLVSHTSCKNVLKSNTQTVETPDSLSCINYLFDKQKNKLTIKHINAAFNCCPDNLYCKIELKNDTILVHEHEKSANCKCNCLYDLAIEIEGVSSRKYQIKFIEPYISKEETLEFEMNLMKDTNGSYCVTRESYPWNME